MQDLSKAQRARLAIRMFKTTADALALRGMYRPSGKSGQTLAQALRMISPEIYGSMNDPRIMELNGLEYVIDRLPKGIEGCSRIILTAQDELERTDFERIVPPKRRRSAYRISETEICFVITRGLSEIYDILTHLTFLHIESIKLWGQVRDSQGAFYPEWAQLQSDRADPALKNGQAPDRALWNLSIILGRTFEQTRTTYQLLEKNRQHLESNDGLFEIIYRMGMRIDREKNGQADCIVYFTPSLKEMIGSQKYGEQWARAIQKQLGRPPLEGRPLHIISANKHSVLNLLYGYAALNRLQGESLYAVIPRFREQAETIREFARKQGMYELPDQSGSHIDCQIFDMAALADIPIHPELKIAPDRLPEPKPVILVMDYAFGAQAFEVMEELLSPVEGADPARRLNVCSVSVMGKAGILPGKKGDILLASAHVFEGTPHNYMVDNDLGPDDFAPAADIDVHVGPIVTVLGTSLQNQDVLRKFQTTSWKAIGLEMEGGHYHRAISAAIIRGHIRPDVRVRYAYYASDNPLISGQTLSSGGMGEEGIRPTYLISKVILEKILTSSNIP